LTLRSGVHATVAGVALAMTIPASVKINQIRFYVRSKYMIERFRDAYSKTPLLQNEIEQAQLFNLQHEIRSATPLILRLTHALQPWITFCIMPIFALANAGVKINLESFGMLTHPVALGIFFGLLLGKPIGITLMSWITIKLKLAAMPDKTRWMEMIGAGMLAGIGFTMSIFIDTIAFSGADEQLLQNAGKLAILITSTCAGIFGLIYMKIITKKE
jgi:NhaA family Na+:H+ antiporter